MSPFFKNSRNIKMFYQLISEEKTGPVIVFVHGYGSSTSLFSEQIKILKKDFKLLLFDAEGHGQSESSDDYLKEQMTVTLLKDLELMLDSLLIHGEIGFIGHSLLGCAVAQMFALKHPEKVKFLILLNGGSIILDSTIRNIFWNLLPPFTRMNFLDRKEEVSHILIDRTVSFIKSTLKDDLDERGIKISEDELENKIREDLSYLVDEEINSQMIQCPTLIIGAELDNFAPVNMAKILQNKIPGAELQIVTMAGHFGMSHRANEYNKRIKGFLIKQGFIPKGEKKNESKSG